MLGCRSRPVGWHGQGGTPRVPALLRGRGSPYGNHLYSLVKGWEAQTASVVGDQGITDLQHFQRRFETRLDWRWSIKLGCYGARAEPWCGERRAAPGMPGTPAEAAGGAVGCRTDACSGHGSLRWGCSITSHAAHPAASLCCRGGSGCFGRGDQSKGFPGHLWPRGHRRAYQRVHVTWQQPPRMESRPQRET